MLFSKEIRGALEAILFVRTEAIKADELSVILGISAAEAGMALKELEEYYNNSESGLQIVETDQGYAMCTRPNYHEFVRKANQPLIARLSQAALETLAIIAYQQPITRPEIEAVRGVRVDRALQSLVKRGLIAEVGRREIVGRPLLYGTTNDFLKLFGLGSLEELPRNEEVTGIEQVT